MRRFMICAAAGLWAFGSLGQNPVPVNPSDMLHLLITQNGSSLDVSFETPVFETPVLVDRNESYTGPGSVLSNIGYNSQYGWLANGFFNFPFGAAIWVAPVAADEGLLFYDESSFAPIHGTDGSDAAWRWSGQMTHNWVAATAPGEYEATFEVYFGDVVTGAPLPGFTPGEVTVDWVLPGLETREWALGGPAAAPDFEQVFGPVPAPGTLSALLLSAALVRRRR
ncbi:MAG: hypothetical protein AAGF47_04680 [Planctomycetota bacterium]